MIEVSGLTKYYGDFLAVDNLSFEIEDGHVYGFLGPNGAGKSTTMNIITGCLSPSSGSVKIGEYDILQQPQLAKKLIGYLPEQPPLYGNETPIEYLTFVGNAKGLNGKQLKQEIDEVVKSTGIEKVKNNLINTLSKGYKQRVGIAQALLGHPQVIILDEPTVGLDPLQIIEIRDFIKELGKTHTVILSSHILSEVQAICEKVLIISKGKLVAFDAPENLEKLLLACNTTQISVTGDRKTIENALTTIQFILEYDIEQDNDDNHINVTFKPEFDIKQCCKDLIKTFVSNSIAIYELHSKKANLEDVFLELTENEQPLQSEEKSANDNTDLETNDNKEVVIHKESEGE